MHKMCDFTILHGDIFLQRFTASRDVCTYYSWFVKKGFWFRILKCRTHQHYVYVN